MERYIVIDTKNNSVWYTSDLSDQDSGGSTQCSDKFDLAHTVLDSVIDDVLRV